MEDRRAAQIVKSEREEDDILRQIVVPRNGTAADDVAFQRLWEEAKYVKARLP